jgi:branched-chain amino acid transport system ATP-binding protein
VVARLSQQGTAVLLVEQLIGKALAVAHRVYALSQGRIVLEAAADAENLTSRLEHAYFGAEPVV